MKPIDLSMSVTKSFLLCLCLAVTQQAAAESGTDEDNAYAKKLWEIMRSQNLIGENRIRSFPFEGHRPHGSIQEVIATDAVVEGHKGRLIVKHNYGADKGITPQSVYAADEAQNYVALTIMFQREAGYDEDNHNWFWAEYHPDGSVIKYQGKYLSGRSELCIGCHTTLGGADREILNGKQH